MVTDKVPALGEVANFGTDYFLLKKKFLSKRESDFTTKFAIGKTPISSSTLFFRYAFQMPFCEFPFSIIFNFIVKLKWIIFFFNDFG